jgi:hypothetical protein
VMDRGRRKDRSSGPTVRFDAGRVFTPAEAKASDFDLDVEAARFKARKGQAGNRRLSHAGPDHCPGCLRPLDRCSCGGLWTRN